MGLGIKTMLKKKLGASQYVTVAERSADKLLAGKNILITGGATGIGYEAAKECVKQGANVIIASRNEQKLDQAVEKIKKLGFTGNVSRVIFDVSNTDEIDNKLQEVISVYGSIDMLVNNAGIYRGGINNFNMTRKTYDEIMDTNLRGPVFLTNAVVKYWCDNNIKGNIVFVSSETAVCAYTNPYALSKGALVQYAKGCAYELASKGIRANIVAPGGTVSEITRVSKEQDLQFPAITGRLCVPEEIASSIIFLLSDLSGCLNGQLLECNGGNTLQVEFFR